MKNNSKSVYSFSNLRPSVFHKATVIDLLTLFDGTRYGGPTLNFMSGIHFGLLLFIRFLAWKEIFLFSRVSRRVLEHTQHPIQWAIGTLSQLLMQLRPKIYTHLHLVHRLRIIGSTPPVRGDRGSTVVKVLFTNWKVAGSIPVGVIGIFHWHKILPIALRPWGRLSL